MSNSCNPTDHSLPCSSVHGISQAKILEWDAIPFHKGSSWLRDWTLISCIAGRFFTTEPPGKPWCRGSSSFLIMDDTVALDCIWNGCYNLCVLCVLFYIQVQCLRNLTGALKENPFTISCITKLFSASVTSSSCLSLCFLWASSSFRSSLVNSSCCIATSSMRLSSCRSSLK